MKRLQATVDGEKAALTPEQRFPEFRDAPEWETVRLGEVSIPVTERVGNRQLTPVSISAGTGFVPQSEKFGRDISGNQYERYTVVRDGDFVYNKGNSLKFPQGCVYQLRGWGEVAVPNVFISFRLKQGYSDGFFQSCFERNLHGIQLKKHITSGARSNGLLNISKEHFYGVEIPVPSHAEQQKIAECLSTLDELIGAESQKLDALKAHKKGLMQQLFPREGETLPRLRFPEFQEAPEWEQRILCDVTDSVFDGTHQTPRYVESGVPFYSVENLISGNANKFISREDYIAATRKNKPEKGDILLTRIGKVGYSRIVTWEHDFSVYVTLAVIKQSPLFASHYLHFFFQSDRYQAELRTKSLPNAVPPKINLDSLRATVVLLPQAAEQHRIASCLSTLDDLIAAQSTRIDALKTHKQGMMQQLFPSPSAEAEA